MRSRGTKETQGVNGDAAALGRKQGAALSWATGREPCPYPGHRGLDWSLTGSPNVVCGVCHPPAGTRAVRG